MRTENRDRKWRVKGVRVSGLALFAVAALIAPGIAAAQVNVNAPLVFDALGSALIEKASPWLLRASRDSTRIPLEIILPEGATAPHWSSVREFLMRSLHGRPITADDRSMRVLSLSAAMIGSDTLRAMINVGYRTRCNGDWIDDVTSYTISWSRGAGDYWRYPRREEAVVADSFGCPVRQ